MDTLGKRLAQGDHAAFAELYDACADRLRHYLMVLLGSEEDAEDALQETFVRLARHHKRLARIENLTAYIFTIARNEALRLAGRRKKPASPAAMCQQLGLFEEVIKDDSQTSESIEAAAIALSRLEPEMREVVELKFFAGLTFREIADVTGCPQGTVATRYRTALEKMRTFLAKDFS
jgi:RNA polymerase sigma-70 factor (ECF subfamily)